MTKVLSRSVLVLAGLLATGACDKSDSPGEPTSMSSVVNYDALGASDTIGFGGSAPCLPLVECTSGSGYVQQVTRRLQSEGRSVTLQNLGIPGAVLSPDVQALGNSLGLDIFRNTLLDGAPYVRRASTLVTVFIGANDANAVGRAVRNGHGGSNPSGYIQTQIQNFARDMQTLVSTVRGRSPDVRIVALNLPNMANTPYAAGLPLSEKRVLQQLTVGFSAGINALAAQGVVVVDLMCDPNFYNPGIFSADGFHPNDAGYSYLTDLVYAAAIASTPAPRASCALMTVY
jgi:lysophospholipase L1-like esterase